MLEKPILFSTPMVQAIIAFLKGMTRRTSGLENVNEDPDNIEFIRFQEYKDGSYRAIFQHKLADEPGSVKCPYGQPGDLLWVRETWCVTQPFDPETYYFGYKCGIQPYSNKPASEEYNYLSPDKWKPSIHMPKAAARICLQVEEIRVERLNEISEEDALAEGVNYITRTSGICYMDYRIGAYIFPFTAKKSFKTLFLSINGKPSPNRERGNYGKILSYTAIAWDQEDFDINWEKYHGIYRNKPLSVIINPWVWVVKFKILSTTGKPELTTDCFVPRNDASNQ